eukprot:Lankesteria_metandrocarpae@DN5462_c1_g1_i7.p1
MIHHICHELKGESDVYTCNGDNLMQVCQETNGIYFAVRGAGIGHGFHKFPTSLFGVEGARALAYLVAEYRSHPDLTQKQLDRKVLNKRVREGVAVVHALQRSVMRYGIRGRKSISFPVAIFGNARAEILAVFAALIHSSVVLSGLAMQGLQSHSTNWNRVAERTYFGQELYDPFETQNPPTGEYSLSEKLSQWWDTEGKPYLESVPGGRPKEVGEGCAADVAVRDYICYDDIAESRVYTCNVIGSGTCQVCQGSHESYFAVRVLGKHHGCHKYFTSVYGIKGARALAYLTAEYRSHPDFTQKQLDPKVLNKSALARGVSVSNQTEIDFRMTYNYNGGCKSLSFSMKSYGKARAEILAVFAALIHSSVVLSGLAMQGLQSHSTNWNRVAERTYFGQELYDPFETQNPPTGEYSLSEKLSQWWDTEGKPYLESVPGGRPKEVGEGCAADVAVRDYICYDDIAESRVYTCNVIGSGTCQVCQGSHESYFAVRVLGKHHGCHKYFTSVYGIKGARALAYLTAEYRSHPDFTQKQLDRKVLNKVVRVRGIRVSHAVDRALVRFGNHGAKSVSFLYSAFGKARAEILASFAAVLQSEVVLSASPHCRYSRSPNRNKVV